LIFFPSPGHDVPVTVELIKKRSSSEISQRISRTPSIRVTEGTTHADLNPEEEEVTYLLSSFKSIDVSRLFVTQILATFVFTQWCPYSMK
jgi:hypothetical protein